MVEPTSLTTQSSPAAASALSTCSRQRAHRRAGEADVRAVERLLERAGGDVDRAQLAGPLQAPRVAPEPDHLDAPLTGGQADRSADQPDAEDRDSHRARRARTAAASVSSTETVVSKSMQASVIDCP